MAMSPHNPSRNEGIRRFAMEAGWDLIDANRLVDGLGGWRGDGALVTLRDDPATLSFVRILRRGGVPVVDLTVQKPGVRIPRVCLDNRAVGRLAAAHFAERNHRHAAFFSTHWMNVHAERYAGFSEGWASVARASGPPMRWVLREGLTASRRNDSRAVAEWFAGLLRSAPKPLALFCHCDEDAARVLAECRALGVAVPEEIAILGAGDNAMICETQSVPLSSITLNGERHGYEAAALLQGLMDGNQPPRGPLLVPPGRLTVRASTDRMAASDPLVSKALALIDENIFRPWGVAQLSRTLGVSPLKLNRHFQAELRRPPSAEILRQRLERAKRLILDGVPIAETAARCGFCNASYLSNRFRENTGLSPSAWRNARADGDSGM